MWCWKELRKPYKLVWNGHPKPNGITVMLFLFTIPCTTAHLMKCALTNMRLIRSKPSTQICATTWNDWRVNPDVSQEEYNRWLRTCNSLSIVITTDNWPSAASQNMLRTWSTSFVLYLRHSQIGMGWHWVKSFQCDSCEKGVRIWVQSNAEIFVILKEGYILTIA